MVPLKRLLVSLLWTIFNECNLKDISKIMWEEQLVAPPIDYITSVNAL